MNQDFAAWVGQGSIADRTKEHLGRSDRGVIMMRKRFEDDLAKLKADNQDPKAVVRDPAVNSCIKLPLFDRDYLIQGPTRDLLADTEHPRTRSMLNFVFQAGQPPDVREAYDEAMGF